jgi:predicted signal transduction protein with EAL and GGDEF domain
MRRFLSSLGDKLAHALGGWDAVPRDGHARAEYAVEEALRAGTQVTLAYLNVQDFRSAVRRFGADGADGLLRALGQRLASAFGHHAVQRLPGDEFLLVLPGADPASTLRELASLVAVPFARPGGSVSLASAIGVAASPQDGTSFRELFGQAECGMLAARAERAPRRGAGAQGAGAREDEPEEEALRTALARNEFVLHYQPQVDLRTGAITGAEALVRWAHPERGLLAPAEFIAAAERTGMIVPIGDWVIREACRQAARWRADGCERLVVAVNLSARQFEDGTLVRTVREALDSAGLPPSGLELELTETILIHDTDNVLAQIRQLKDMGLALSLDDFGTGYSSLSYLKKFSVDKIKIDRSFVSGLDNNPNDAAIVRAIIHIARSLGLSTIAEGVEDGHTLGCLQLLHCDEVQGYYFSPPMCAAAFGNMLAVLARYDWAHERPIDSMYCSVIDDPLKSSKLPADAAVQTRDGDRRCDGDRRSTA